MAGFGITMVGLSIMIQRRHAQICAEHDLTPAQAQLLCMVKEQPRGMKDLAQLLGLERPGLTGLVIRAEKLGLVQREGVDHDRRAVTVSPTPAGKKAVDALYADIDALIPELLDTLPPADRAAFEQVLDSLGDNPMLFAKPGSC